MEAVAVAEEAEEEEEEGSGFAASNDAAHCAVHIDNPRSMAALHRKHIDENEGTC